MRTMRLLGVIFGLAGATAALALPPGIMRCTRPDGSIYYTDAGCPEPAPSAPTADEPARTARPQQPQPRSRPRASAQPPMRMQERAPETPARARVPAADPWRRADFPSPPPDMRF